MMHEHEEFEVETDRAGEPPLSFWSETVLGVMVEAKSLERRWDARGIPSNSALSRTACVEDRLNLRSGQGTIVDRDLVKETAQGCRKSTQCSVG